MKGTLKTQKDFERVFRYGKKMSSNFFDLFYLENKEEKNRIGFAVSKKIKGSVKRNRIKRLLREAYRSNKKNFGQGFDLIILGKETLRDKKLVDVMVALEEVLIKVENPPISPFYKGGGRGIK